MVDLLTVADYWLDLEQTQQVVITAPLTIKVGQKANFDAIQTYLKDFNPENYFWDFGDGNRAKGIKVEHTYMSSGSFIVKCGTISESNPTIKHCSYIEITVID
jgi:PKD repeat protein